MRLARMAANRDKHCKTGNWGLVKSRKNCYTMDEGYPENGRALVCASINEGVNVHASGYNN